MQFSYIIQNMKPKHAQIAAHPNPQTGTACAMFELARDHLLSIVGPFQTGDEVILCGGIQISMAKPCDDNFETHSFKAYKDGKAVQDLMTGLNDYDSVLICSSIWLPLIIININNK
jgi:hypothetical protein